MTGKLLWAMLAVAWGIVLTGGQNWAAAQNDAEQSAADVGSAAKAQHSEAGDSSHADNMQDRSEGSDRQAEGSNRQTDRNRSWSDDQQRDGQQGDARQSNDGRQRSDRRNRNSDSQANNQRDSRRGREGQNWQSDIRFGEQRQNGLVIATIGQGTPFYRGGLREGDVIVSYNGRQIRSESDFQRWADQRGGERIPVIVLRDGQRETVYIQYDGDRNDARSYANTTGSYEPQAFLGVRFETRIRNGAVISAVVPGSPADDAGLKSGDEIVAINGRQVESPREVTRMVESMQPGDKIDIEFSRRSEEHTEAVLKEHPRELASAQYQQGETQGRQGQSQYDRGIEQSSYDEDSAIGARDEYNQYGSERGTTERSGERRGGRILPRLRN